MSDKKPVMHVLQLGQMPRTSDREIITAQPGRRCECGTKLSVFNLDTQCSGCENRRNKTRAW